MVLDCVVPSRGYICPDKRPPGKKPQLLEVCNHSSGTLSA